ncbi:MAG: hypothetical protein HYY55_02285 [Candidatus Niyogibacteria bacterium]|nr:MAG: hypothetical protein HYY55_02285 [Candidatus Niyogibacteria bacterium]
MSKIVRIIKGGRYFVSFDLAPIKEAHGDKLKGITICVSDSENEAVQCVDYSIYYTDPFWVGNSLAGGVKLIDEERNGSGMANQGGTDWKEGMDSSEALSILSRILNALLEAEKIEVAQEHP